MKYDDLKTILSLTEKLCECQLCIFTRQEMLDYCEQFYDHNCNSDDDHCFAILSNGEHASTYDEFCSKTKLRQAKAIYFSGAWGNAYFLSIEARKDDTFFNEILADVNWQLEIDYDYIFDTLPEITSKNYASSLIQALKKALAEKTATETTETETMTTETATETTETETMTTETETMTETMTTETETMTETMTTETETAEKTFWCVRASDYDSTEIYFTVCNSYETAWDRKRYMDKDLIDSGWDYAEFDTCVCSMTISELKAVSEEYLDFWDMSRDCLFSA